MNYDVQVKITTIANIRVEAASPAEAREKVARIDVLDAEYLFDVMEEPEIDWPTHDLQVEGVSEAVDDAHGVAAAGGVN